jgi:hypothetical protein
MMTEDDPIAAKILGCIGNEVKFTYPPPEACKKGKLIDRAVIASPGVTGVPYWDVIDLIEFRGEPEPQWMRIGYYRKPKDKLIFAGQTTITEPIGTWKKLLVHAAKEKPWFCKLLEDVIAQVHERKTANN